MKIKSGQTVTFSGSFAAHPLDAACQPASAITNVTTGASTTVTFTTIGYYNYYCTFHGTSGGTGMAGSIEVVP
jgi:plastocyanin